MAIDPTVSLPPPNVPFNTTLPLDLPPWCNTNFHIQHITRAMPSILQSCTTLAFFDLPHQIYRIPLITSALDSNACYVYQSSFLLQT